MKSLCALWICSIGFLASIQTSHAQRKSLLIIDVQDKFYRDKSIYPPSDELVNNINRAIQTMPPDDVIYIKATEKVLSISFKGIKTYPITPAPGIDTRLNVVSQNVFTKNEADAFTVDSLNEILERKQVQELFIVGQLAEECVYQSAMGGLKKGYAVTIVPEAISCYSMDRKEKAYKKLINKGVRIVPLNELSSSE
ncbi:MAG: isochorismatase family cysteine hydrolase [Flavobacteriales bacterium]